MPNNLENDNSIIKKILIENNGSYKQANIGTSAEYVDYNGSSIADALEDVQQQLTDIAQQVESNSEQITIMDETFGNAKKVINKINSMSNKIDNLSQNISNEVQKNINETTFFTKDIIWQDNLARNLRSVLGNLINLPLQAINLRDWIEKISAGKISYEKLNYVPLSNYGYIEQDTDISDILRIALKSGKNIFIDLLQCKIQPGSYTLQPGQKLKGSPTIIKVATTQEDLVDNNYDQITAISYQLGNETEQVLQRLPLVTFNTKGGAIEDFIFTQTTFLEQLQMPAQSVLNSPDIFLNNYISIDNKTARGVGNIVAVEKDSSESHNFLSEFGDFYSLLPPSVLKTFIDKTFVAEALGKETSQASMLYNMLSFDENASTALQVLKSLYSSRPLIEFNNVKNSLSQLNYNFKINNCIFNGGTINCKNKTNNQFFISECSFINRQTLNNNLQLLGSNYDIEKSDFINGYYGIAFSDYYGKNMNINNCKMKNTQRCFYLNNVSNINLINITYDSHYSLFFRILSCTDINIENIFSLDSLDQPNEKKYNVRGSILLEHPAWAQDYQCLGQLIEQSSNISLKNIQISSYTPSELLSEQLNSPKITFGLICSGTSLQIQNCKIDCRLILERTSGNIYKNKLYSLLVLDAIQNNIKDNLFLGIQSISYDNYSSQHTDTTIDQIDGLTTYENVYQWNFSFSIGIFNSYKGNMYINNNVLSNNQMDSLVSGITIGMFSANIFSHFTGYLFKNYYNKTFLLFNTMNSEAGGNGSTQTSGITYLETYQNESLILCPTLMWEPFKNENNINVDRRLFTNVMFKTPFLPIQVFEENEENDQSFYFPKIISTYRIIPVSLLDANIRNEYLNYNEIQNFLKSDFPEIKTINIFALNKPIYNIYKLQLSLSSSNSGGTLN